MATYTLSLPTVNSTNIYVVPVVTAPMQPPETLTDAAPTKAANLKQQIYSSLRQSSQPGIPHSLGSIMQYTIQLPCFEDLREPVCAHVKKVLIDRSMELDLAELRVVNWCRTVQVLYPVQTKGDGNCLLHAVSMAMWGLADKAMLLRRLLYIALVQDEGQGHFQKRWQRERERLDSKIPDEEYSMQATEWREEWTMLTRAAEDLQRGPEHSNADLPFESLEEIHVFVLANILRRPIVILAESVVRSLRGSALAPCNFSGVYLPLLLDPKRCAKSPLVLAYNMNHFTPLIGCQDTSSTSNLGRKFKTEHAVPLVNYKLEPIAIHFLSEREEIQAHELLQNYLNVSEIHWTKSDGIRDVLVAKLDYVQIPEEYDLMTDFVSQVCDYFDSNKRGSNNYDSLPNSRGEFPEETCKLKDFSKEKFERRPCVTRDCPYSGKEEYGWRCYSCVNKYGRTKLKDFSKEKFDERPCVTRDCPYSGKAEYGWRCYSCVIKYGSTKGDVSVLKQNVTGKSSSGSNEDMKPIPSYTNCKCLADPCQNLASRHTFPYCHEHNDSNRGELDPESFPKLTRPPIGLRSPSYNYKDLIGENLDQPPALRGSLDEKSLAQAERCKELGCTMYGLSDWGFYCSQHRKDQTSNKSSFVIPAKEKNFIPNAKEKVEQWMKDLPKNPYKKSESGSGSAHSSSGSQSSSSDPGPCISSCCGERANIKCNGYCATCFLLKDMKEEMAKVRHKDKYAQEAKTSSASDESSTCGIPDRKILKTSVKESCDVRDVHGKSIADKTMKTPVQSNLSEADILSLRRLGVARAPSSRAVSQSSGDARSHRVSRNCDLEYQRPGTDIMNIADESKILNTQTGSAARIRTEESNDILPKVEKTSNSSEKSSKVSPEENRQHQILRPKHQPTKSHFRPSRLVTAPYGTGYPASEPYMCIAPSCVQEGQDSYNGLCQECFHVLRNRQASKGAQLEGTEIKPTAFEALDPLLIMPCLTEGCEMYGTEEQLFFCTRCYAKHQTKPAGVSKEITTSPKFTETRKSAPRRPHSETYGKHSTPEQYPRLLHSEELHPPKPSGNNILRYPNGQRKAVNVNPAPQSPTNWDRVPSTSGATRPEEIGKETVHESYTGLMKRLENSSRTSVRQCREHLCTNFGHPSKDGYCNACFVKNYRLSCD